MKRKVIQIANSTQLISLPRKWAQRFNIKKGDELEVDEQGNRIIVSTEGSFVEKKAEVDVTGLDRTSILYMIRALYKKGYNEINIKFSKPTTMHYRINKNVSVLSVIHEEVNRLAGIEVIRQGEDFCLIKSILHIDPKEFEGVLRRLFLLLIDANKDFLEGLSSNDRVLLGTIEQKHDSITRFVSYCLRILSIQNHEDTQKALLYYHIIANIDKITDVIKYSSRYALESKMSISKEGQNILKMIEESIAIYYDLFYKFSKEKVVNLYENRDRIRRMIFKSSKTSRNEEVVLLNSMSAILEMVTDITDARIGIEY